MITSLITGANGFTGSNMAEYLLKKGHRVICQVRKTSDLTNLADLEVEYRYGDVALPETLPSILEDIEYIFHFAGKTKARSEAEYMLVNAEGTANLAKACLNAPKLKMLVYISSLAAVGPQQNSNPVNESTPPKPLTAYGRSKLKGEELLRQICGDKIPWCIIRPTGVYGPKDKDIFIYFKTINRGWKILLSGTKRMVSLIHAQDLADICYLASQKSPPGEIYMASDGKGYTWEELSVYIEKALNKNARKLIVPMCLTTPAALMSEFIGRFQNKAVALNREKIRELRAPGWVCSIRKAEKTLGFQVSFPIEEGVAETAKWYREKGWL
ncbi:MAG: NAD-dependent epimerase/dehydratase family protein [candidate division Zixibacteria bacterium]|nr:NAD-dependent epimerase/dehydratase family protein [Candidatus Tariuqbacter arcticus]